MVLDCWSSLLRMPFLSVGASERRSYSKPRDCAVLNLLCVCADWEPLGARDLIELLYAVCWTKPFEVTPN